jgi:carbonic anhydrase
LHVGVNPNKNYKLLIGQFSKPDFYKPKSNHMKNFNKYLLSTLVFVLLFSCNSSNKESQSSTEQPQAQTTPSARPTHWSYSENGGPAKWGDLDPVYAICAKGNHQSPIDLITTATSSDLGLKFDYKTSSVRIAHNEHMEEIIDNGHTIQVTVDEGSTITLGNAVYELKQFHFHTPSEHTVNGVHMPMEMHMVHQSTDGKLAVVSILFEEGEKPNANFEVLIANLPNKKGESLNPKDQVLHLQPHVEKITNVYHYVGSLTTPPCSEDVQWIVVQQPVSLTKAEIEAFSSRIGPNNRPVQPLNDRSIGVEELKVGLN